MKRRPSSVRAILLGGLAANFLTGLKLLVTEFDGLIYNVVDPFGFFYRVSLPVALVGLGLLAFDFKGKARVEHQFLVSWIGSAILLAASCSPSTSTASISSSCHC